jgi:hypothetical protein
VTAESPTLLEYASPRDGYNEPWRPLFFKFSRPSVALLLILAAAVTWLALRHDPWRLTATIPCDLNAGNPFTADNQLLVLDTQRGVNLYDPTTGRHIRQVLPTLDSANFRYTIINGGGSQIIGLPLLPTGRVTLLDVATGRTVVSMEAPRTAAVTLWLPSPDGTRLITPGYRRFDPIGLESDTTSWLLWEISAARGDRRPTPLRTLPNAGSCAFSSDGSRILMKDTADTWILLDARTGDIIKRGGSPPGVLRGCAFNGAHLFYTFHQPWAPQTPMNRVEIYEAHTGQYVRAFDLPFTTLLAELSDDGDYFLCTDPLFRGNLPGNHLHVVHTPTGRIVSSGNQIDDLQPLFLPGSSRYLATNRRDGLWAVFGLASPHPLAILPHAKHTTRASFSPDAQTIARHDGRDLHLYRPAGPDCPESTLGLLAFPATWLITLALFAAVASLAADARRARTSAATRIPPPLLTTGLLILASLFTLQFALTAALGRFPSNPAPLLLLAAIGLTTHSRFWRVVTLWLLAATFPFTLYLLGQIYRAGVNRSSTWHVFDRYHEVPHLPPFIALALLSVLCALGILLLARARRQYDADN